MLTATNIIKRTRLTISGTVQGVGFRPFVYRYATRESLSGFVRNSGGKVEVEVEGPAQNIQNFISNLRLNYPVLAVIKDFELEELPLSNQTEDGFTIIDSTNNSDEWQSIPPDTAVCQDCIKELFDKNDRRFLYPFINCVNCGPRFTIIKELPYDRELTTMHSFAMCSDCLSEYQNPLNRRYHAQPTACSNCGPKLTLISAINDLSSNHKDNQSVIDLTSKYLHDGKIIAIKSLGGFHLACDATNEIAVNELRKRKNRHTKPFAIMLQNTEQIEKYCHLSEQEKDILNRKESPILLLERKNSSASKKAPYLANNIAQNTNLLGVLVPYTPLHHILLSTFDKPLIMTSGNTSDEPIAIDNQQAIMELENIADYFLIHDRDIATRYDDSIVRISMSIPNVLRRSRGFAPQPLRIKNRTKKTILSFGAQLKNTFCFLNDDQAFISPHIGNLDNLKTIEYFEKTLALHRNLFKMKEEIIACDLHPDYTSTKLAHNLSQTKQLPLISIQHHHAHIASCMIEHNLPTPVIGIAFDGTGYGSDKNIWGGECLITSFDKFKRFAFFELVSMPGGNQAILHPWRMALSYIQLQKDQNIISHYIDQLKTHIDIQNIDIVQQQIIKNFNSPLTSSCGRLFDAVSSLLGICHSIDYEGQAAIELETIAALENSNNQFSIYPYSIDFSTDKKAYIVKTSNLIRQIMEDKANGVKINIIARRFHETIAQIITDLCLLANEQTSISTICLTGGVFQNNILLQSTIKSLKSKNFSVYFPQQIPINDGGISLGQAVIAAAQTDNLF